MTVRIIDSQDRFYLPRLDPLWRYRELIWLFARRHVTSRYRQMALGFAWAILEPLFQLLLMSLVFGMLLRVNSNGYPYAIYVFAALIPWQHSAAPRSPLRAPCRTICRSSPRSIFRG